MSIVLTWADILSDLRKALDGRVTSVQQQLESVEDLKKKSYALYKERKKGTLALLEQVVDVSCHFETDFFR